MNTIDPPFVFNADYGHARSYRYERLLCEFCSFFFFRMEYIYFGFNIFKVRENLETLYRVT